MLCYHVDSANAILKVYKRGAVGRSIDITRYLGYDELKQGLARMFGIEGQLEDRQRIGWKFVYVDHENDVLLLGDDPWEYVFIPFLLTRALFSRAHTHAHMHTLYASFLGEIWFYNVFWAICPFIFEYFTWNNGKQLFLI